MKRISIRWRMMLWNTGAFAVLLIGFGILLFLLLRQTHLDQIDRGLQARYQEVLSDPRLATEPEQRFPVWVKRFGKHVEIAGLVSNEQGVTVSSAETLTPLEVPAIRSLPSKTPQFDNLTLPQHGPMRRLTVTVPTSQGDYTLMLLAELEHMNEELAIVAQALLITVVLALVAGAILAYLLARQALAPVEQIRRQTDQITAQRLNHRLPILNPNDELGHLAQTINSMIARLERSFEEIRRFTADASHELRTPLAVIRSEAEMALAIADRPSETRSRLDSILEECNRLAAMVGQLLTLSREDSGVVEGARESVSLKELLQEIVELYQPLAASRQQILDAELANQVKVTGDRERLRQAFQNLIDNAIKYTSQGGQIRIELQRNTRNACVTVQDSGIGISPADLPHVFERFYRASKGRESEVAGSGLGLSIVQSILMAHGGEIDVRSEPGQGTTFTVTLLLADACASDTHDRIT